MDKSQAIQNLWSNFDLPVYDENSVPKDAVLPYITYSVSTDSLDKPVVLQANLWYHSTRWDLISKKAEEISKFIGERGYCKVKLDDGYMWVTKGTPFAQRMDSGSDTIKRMYINVIAEFLTSY